MSGISEEAGAGGAEPAARRPVVAWTLSGLAGLAGGIQGFLFGDQLGGPLLGVVVAINAAAMAALLTSGLFDAVARLMRRP
jgi:hypothetical protein